MTRPTNLKSTRILLRVFIVCLFLSGVGAIPIVAFAHFVLAILFIGPYRDPIRNIWVIQFGLNACVLIIPFAFIAGYFRRIPIGWTFIDCSFGIIGFLLLQIVLRQVKLSENYSTQIYTS